MIEVSMKDNLGNDISVDIEIDTQRIIDEVRAKMVKGFLSVTLLNGAVTAQKKASTVVALEEGNGSARGADRSLLYA